MAQSDMSLIEQVIQEFERARKEGKRVNEERYAHIIQGYENLRSEQKTRLAALDTKFGTLASDLSTLSGNVSDAMQSIADGTRSDVIGKGETRVEDTAGRFDAGQSRLEGLASAAGVKVGEEAGEASRKIGELGEGSRTGLLGRGRKNIDSLVEKFKKEASAQRKIVESGRGKVKAGYESLQSKDEASRNSAAEKVLSGYEKSVDKIGKLFGGAQKTAKAGFKEARSDVSTDAAGAAGRTEARFDEGRGGVGEDFAGARKTVEGISGGAIDKAGQLGESARQKTSSLAEERLGGLREGYGELGAAAGDSARATGAKFGGSLADLRDTAATGYSKAGADAAADYAGGRADVEGKFSAAKDERAERYGKRTQTGMDMIKGMGDASRSRIRRDARRRRIAARGRGEQSLINRGMSNTTEQGMIDRATEAISESEDQALAAADAQEQQQAFAAFQQMTAQGMSAEDAMQASGLGASSGLLGQEKASQQRLRESGVGTDVALGREQAAGVAAGDARGDAAELQTGLTGLAQQAAGQQSISSAEQAAVSQALSGQLGALQQGTGAQMDLAGREAAAKTGVRGQGLSASQQIEAEALARRAGLSGSQAAGTQALAGQQAGAMATGGMQTAAAADRIAQQNRAAGTQLGLSGMSAEERAAAALEQQMGQQGLARLSAQAAGEGQQRSADAALTGQQFGSQVGALGAGQSAAAGLTSQGMGNQANLLSQGLGLTGGQRGRLTDIDAQLAGAGQGARLGQESANYGTQASVGLGALGQGARSDAAQTELGVEQRRFEADREDPSVTLKDMADLVMAAGQSGMGSQGNVGTGLGSGGPTFAQQQLAAQNEWMRKQAVAGHERQQAAVAQEREAGKQRLREKAAEQQAQRDREAFIRKEERMTNEERFDRESKKLDSARQEGQDKVDGLNSELRAAEAAGNAALTGELRTQLEEAKARAAKLEEGQKVIDTARDRATDTGGRMGNITVNVTTGAVTVGQNEVKGGDGEWKYETEGPDGTSYQDTPSYPGDTTGGGNTGGWTGTPGGTPPPSDSGGFGTQPASPTPTPTQTTSTPTQTTSPTPTQTTPTQTTSTPTQPQQPDGGQPKPGTGGGATTSPDVYINPNTGQPWQPWHSWPNGADGKPLPKGPDGKPVPEGSTGGPPKPAGEQPIQTGKGFGDDVPAGSKWDERIQKWIDPNGGMYNEFGGKETLSQDRDSEEFKNYFDNLPAGEPGTEGVPGPTGPQGPSGQGQPGTGLPGLGGGGFNNGQGEQGLPGLGGGGYQGGHPFLGAEQFTYGNPWGQGSYNDFMQSQLAGGENEGLAGLADAAGGMPSTGLVAGSEGGMQGGGGAQTTGIVRGDEGGMSAMGRLGAGAGQPQAQAFAGNAMMGQVAQPQAGGQPAGGQQLAAGPPINDQQMERMMQVIPNIGGDGSALGLGMGGQMAIYQQQLAKQQEMIDASNNQGGGGGGDRDIFGGGGSGGFDPGPSGPSGPSGPGGGGAQRPRPWGQDVVTPSYDPRDPGNQGGGRPLPGVPGSSGQGSSGPGGILNPDIFTRNSGNVNSGQDWRQEQADKEAADKKWEGWNFAKQGNGSSFTDDGVSEFVKNTRESGAPTASHPGGQFQPSGMPAFPNQGGFNDTPAPAGLSELSQQASGRDTKLDYLTGKGKDAGFTQNAEGYWKNSGQQAFDNNQMRALGNMATAKNQSQLNSMQRAAQRYNSQRASAMPASGLSNQSSGGGLPQGMPWAPGQGPAPQIKRKAKGGLGALANQASGMGMMQKPNLTYG